MACEINRNTIENGIVDAASQRLDSSELFTKDEEIFYPKDEFSNYQDLVDDINLSFSEQIVQKFNSEEAYTIIEPSRQLVGQYERAAGLLGDEATPPDDTLTPEQEAQFSKLQDNGLISKESFVHNGETFYKVPQLEGKKDEETKAILDEIIQSKGLNWLHIFDNGGNYVVQLGLREQISDINPDQKPSAQSSKAGQITKNAVLRFLDKVGFTNVKTVSNLTYRGAKVPGQAYIDFGTGVMAIKEDREDYTLPEESMHILVKLIQNSRPELYARMAADVINYNLYREVVNDPVYNSPFYKTENGTPDYEKLKEEAVGKLLAEYLINKLEGTQESARAIDRAYGFWQSVLQWIRDTFGIYKNPFKQAINLMNEDVGEFDDIDSDDVFFSSKPLEEVDSLNPENKGLFQQIENKPEELGIHKEDSNYWKNGVRQTYSREELEGMDPAQRAKIATELGVQGVSADMTSEEAIKKAIGIIMGKKPGRVTDLADSFYFKYFGKRNFDDALQAFYEQSRQDGSYIHEIFEATINAYIDKDTGLLKSEPSELDFPINTAIQRRMAKKIEIFLQNYLGAYEQGTRFLTEQVIYDPAKDRYGTIDLMAILPDKTVDITDWKTMLLQNLESAKDYKKEGISIQLNEYKRILKESYGVQNVRRLRAIPIRKQYQKDANGVQSLKGIEIGNANPTKVEEKYLRPIISPEESTGSPEKDQVIAKLNWLYEKYIERGKFKDDRTVLDEVEEAIYEIRVSNSIENLTRYITSIQGQMRQLSNEGEKAIPTMTKEEANNMLANISFYQSIVDFLSPTILSLQKDNSIDVKERKGLFQAISELNLIKTNLYNTPENPGLREKLMDHLAQKEGIFDLLKPEKVANLLVRYFRSMGSQDIATVRMLYSLTKKSYNRISLETDEDLKSLKSLKNNFEDWRKKNNLSEKDAVGMLVNYQKGTLNSRLSQDFYDKRTEVFESRDGKQILEFIKANYDLTEYNAWYKTTLEQKKAEWEHAVFDAEDANRNRRIIRGRIKDFETKYDIYRHPITAFGSHNTKVWSKNILVDKWETKEYQTLTKKGNEPLLELYNYMVKKNTELADSGAIEDYEVHKFFPNMRKTFADSVTFDEVSTMEKAGNVILNHFSNVRKSMTVGDYQFNFQGARDETGKKIEKRFVPYVSKIKPEDKSFDIFKVYALMSKEVNREKYLQENDEVARTLLHIEKNKQSLLQNKYGTLAQTESGDSIKLSEERGRNIKILEEHVRNIVAGESLQTDSDFVVKASLKAKEKWNNSKLGKLYRFNTDPQHNPSGISATKFVLWLSSANQKRILGVNLSSALANLFGGTFSAGKIYSKYIGKDINVSGSDIRRGWQKMTSGAFYQSETMKKEAALVDYFLPLLDNRENFHASQLSVNKASRILSQEWLMSPMRKTSEIVQLNIFFALLDNTGVIDGKIVNLREKAADDTGYSSRFRLPAGERAAKEKEFNDKLKEYKDKYALAKQSIFKKVKIDGKDETIVEIPGIERGSEDVRKLRDIVQTMSKDSLGETDAFDLANYKYSLFWRLMMTFKNWIPRTFDVRFGEFRYSQSHEAYEYGRVRMLWRALSANYFQTAVKLLPVPFWGKATNAFFTKDAVIKRALETYQEKKATAQKLGKYNEQTFISEDEFVERFVKGTEAGYAELRTLITMSLVLMLGFAAPDDDDDSETKAFKNLMRRQIDKLRDEVGFFYSPKSGIDIAGGGPPIVSLIKDSYDLISETSSQFFGFTLDQMGYEGGEPMMEKAKPAKRFFKMFPFTNQVISYLPAVDEETAKEWGLKISPQKVLY